jgi:hypothetical protein
MLKHGRPNTSARTRRNPPRPDCSGACTVGILAQPFARPPFPFCFHTIGHQLACAWSVALHAHTPAESSRASHWQNTSARTRERAGSIPLGPPGPATPPPSPSAVMPSGLTYHRRRSCAARRRPARRCSTRRCPARRRSARCCPAQLLLLLLLPDSRLLRPCRASAPSVHALAACVLGPCHACVAAALLLLARRHARPQLHLRLRANASSGHLFQCRQHRAYRAPAPRAPAPARPSRAAPRRASAPARCRLGSPAHACACAASGSPAAWSRARSHRTRAAAPRCAVARACAPRTAGPAPAAPPAA